MYFHLSFIILVVKIKNEVFEPTKDDYSRFCDSVSLIAAQTERFPAQHLDGEWAGVNINDKAVNALRKNCFCFVFFMINNKHGRKFNDNSRLLHKTIAHLISFLLPGLQAAVPGQPQCVWLQPGQQHRGSVHRQHRLVRPRHHREGKNKARQGRQSFYHNGLEAL